MVKHNAGRPKGKAQAAGMKQAGLMAFQRGDLDSAIRTWQQLPGGQQPVSALAEAYFRRAIKKIYAPQPRAIEGQTDLEQAFVRNNADPRFAYHLGLLAQREGKLAQALEYYRLAQPLVEPPAAGKADPWRKLRTRLAYVLALALLQTGRDPSADPAWKHLAPPGQARLSPALGLHLPRYQASPEAPPLYRGLVAASQGQPGDARRLFEAALESPEAGAAALAHYYLGVLAARAGDLEAARLAWIEAYRGGLRAPRLRANLGEYFLRIAEDRLVEGELELAQQAAAEAARHLDDDKALLELRSQVEQQLAHRAVLAGEWTTARAHWEAADRYDPGRFRLAYNLALAYEKDELWPQAGQAWRDALRRRPRSADHPDAISDQEVAKLWRRAARAHLADQEGDQAVTALRTCLKYSDTEEVRLELIGALIAAERLEAALNEVDRVLERNPDSIPALLSKGQLLDRLGNWWWGQPEALWKRVLELDPENRAARQLLVDYYIEKAEIPWSWIKPREALEQYLKALGYQPNNPEILAKVAASYIRLDEQPQAEQHLAELQAAPGLSLEHLDQVILAYLQKDAVDQAWLLVDWAETHLPGEVSLNYLLFRAARSYDLDKRSQAERWFERAIARAEAGVPVLAVIGQLGVYLNDDDLARRYSEQAIAAGQAVAHAYLTLGIVAAQADDRALARQHWKTAELHARQAKDKVLPKITGALRSFFSAGSNRNWMAQNFGIAALAPRRPLIVFLSLLIEHVPGLVAFDLSAADDDDDSDDEFLFDDFEEDE
jgi:Tfp pilus assembly protein PilF